jgi:inosine-uridine nucleoside N-ribohydrolase
MAETRVSKKASLIVDTDPGIDDAMALLYLRACPSISIAAITTVFGNASVAATTRNACYLASRFDIDAPIFAGASAPLQSGRTDFPTHVHGENGLGDVAIPQKLARGPAAGAAHERIVELIRSAPHEITVLTLGPMTNLALALRHDPGIAKLVRRVVVMGGAFGWGERRGNVSPVAEANIRSDPHAADEVLAASWPVTVVGLDVTMRCVLGTEAARALATNGGEAGQFLWDISRDYEAMYFKYDGIRGCCLHDVAAAIHVVDPQLFTTVSGPIRVVTEGIAIGQTIQRPPGLQFPPGAWDGAPPHEACRDVDPQALLDLYSRTLIAAAR